MYTGAVTYFGAFTSGGVLRNAVASDASPNPSVASPLSDDVLVPDKNRDRISPDDDAVVVDPVPVVVDPVPELVGGSIPIILQNQSSSACIVTGKQIGRAHV